MKTPDALPRPLDWAYSFDNALTTLARDTKVTKRQVAYALGFDRHLSISTISGSSNKSSDLYHALCSSFSALRVPYVAARLGLGKSDYPRLEIFFDEAIKALLGHDINVRLSRADLRESTDWGIAGIELFGAGMWQKARPYLEASWQNWVTRYPELLKQPNIVGKLSTMLWTGTQLVVLDGLTGERRHARRLVDLNRLVSVSLATAPQSKEVLTAAGSALSQIGVGYRLTGSHDLKFVTGYSQKAVELLASGKVHLEGQLCGLRDQTKPLIKAMLQETSPLKASARWAEAETAYHQADNLAGGDSPREEVYEAWLLTRATWTECLAVAGYGEAAQRLWDSALGMPWMEAFLTGRRHLPIRPKMLMTEMTLRAGQRRLDDLGELTKTFREDPANILYGDRLRRAAALEKYALTGDKSNFWEAVLR